MNAARPQLYNSFTSFSVTPSNTGFSNDSKQLLKKIQEGINHIWESMAISEPFNDALESIRDVYKESCFENWDGYGGIPIKEKTASETLKFIKLLPANIPIPDIIAEPTGELGLEWYKEKHMVFVVSLKGDNELTYAGIFGSNKIHGTEYFNDSLPYIILNNIMRLYQ